MLVEIAGTWLVVGVAPGRVSALHTLPNARCPRGTPRRIRSVACSPAPREARCLTSRRARRGDGIARWRRALPATLALLVPATVLAQVGDFPLLTSTPGAGGSQNYSLPVQTLLLLTALTFLPAVLLLMTGFTRIVIVLSLLRHALGTQASPPNQVLVGLALFLTLFVMGPVFDRVYDDAYGRTRSRRSRSSRRSTARRRRCAASC